MVSMVAFTIHILVLFSRSQTLSLTYFNVCILTLARVYVHELFGDKVSYVDQAGLEFREIHLPLSLKY